MKEKNLTKIICAAISANGKVISAIIAAVVALIAVPSSIYFIIHNGNESSDSGSSDSTSVSFESISDSDSGSTESVIPPAIPVLINFDAIGGNIDITSTVVYYGEKYGDLPEPQKNHYDFNGWYTSNEDGDPIDKDTDVTNSEPHTLYAHWKQHDIKVMLDANGGNVTTDSVTVYYGKEYGSLPVPKRDNYSFKGWYTQINGGSLIKNDTTVETSETHTLYAHWEQNTIGVSFDADLQIKVKR